MARNKVDVLVALRPRAATYKSDSYAGVAIALLRLLREVSEGVASVDRRGGVG